jgi:predicted ribosomally synthesized peptide with SipW-like signal peptide
MNDRFDLSRRKLLGSVATIGAAGAIGGAGSMAFFRDEENLANNQLTAGSLDMKVAYDAYYSDWKPNDQGVAEDENVDVRMYDGAPNETGGPGELNEGEVGLPTNVAWLLAVSANDDTPDVDGDGDTDADDAALQFLDNTQYASEGSASCPDGTDADDLAQPVIELDDVKPGDFGEVTFDFALCDNPGFVWLRGGLRDASENGYTEPERKDDDEDGPENEDTVELLDVVQVAVWIDDGDNYQDGQEEPAFVGSLRDVIVGELGDATPPGVGIPGDLPAEEGGGSGRNCFSAETVHSVAFAWWVPVDHGNEIQTDTATFDLGFYTEQCRHNQMGNNGPDDEPEPV